MKYWSAGVRGRGAERSSRCTAPRGNLEVVAFLSDSKELGPGGQGNLRFTAEPTWAPENGPASGSDFGVGQGVAGRPASLRSLKAPLLNSWALSLLPN